MANMNIYSEQAWKIVDFIAQIFGAQPEFFVGEISGLCCFSSSRQRQVVRGIVENSR